MIKVMHIPCRRGFSIAPIVSVPASATETRK